MRLILIFLVALSSLLVVASCGAPKTCANSCMGCCTADGTCVGGNETAACGSNGATCLNCTVDNGTCATTPLGMACQWPIDAGTGGGGGATGGGGGAATGGGGGAPVNICTRTPVECSDQAIAGLELFSTVASGSVTNGHNGTDFTATIDARGGGFPPTDSYVYVRFTNTGLEQLSISDMTALDSMDWDMAFRRYVIRINSGDSGPSCVGAAVQTQTYDQITAVPANFIPEVDDFLTRPPACTFVDDGSGLGTSPRTYLSSFYEYPMSCVKMTNKAYVIRTQTGRHVKLTVSTYYATEAAQQTCNTTGTSGGAAGGTVRLRWLYLD